jgi:pimeloyl-ACP methyl ester carboxylesterase
MDRRDPGQLGNDDPLHLLVLAPDLAEDEFARAWWARIERAAGSPRRAVRKQELAFQLDVRDVLAAIGVPTMVIQSAGNLFVMPAQGRYLAEHIPGAQYLELASGGHWPWAAPDADASSTSWRSSSPAPHRPRPRSRPRHRRLHRHRRFDRHGGVNGGSAMA